MAYFSIETPPVSASTRRPPAAVRSSASSPAFAQGRTVGNGRGKELAEQFGLRHRLDHRRRDLEPEKKEILVYAAATGARVRNVVRVEVNREFGDLIFQPEAGAGASPNQQAPAKPGTPAVAAR